MVRSAIRNGCGKDGIGALSSCLRVTRSLHMLETQRVKVFWQPGCTSCLRTKEFLTKSGVDYESINVHATPPGWRS